MNELKPCKVAKFCGGCQLQNVSYSEQLRQKQEAIEKLFYRKKVQPIIGMEDPYYYRNKVQVAFGKYKGRVLCGNYVVSTHQIVEVEDCQISDVKANEIIASIKKLAISFHLSIFDEDAMKGFLRHVLIRIGKKTGQIMVVLVSGSFIFPKKKDFINALLRVHPEITTIVLNMNNKRTSMVLSDKTEVLYGPGYIEDILCGKKFKISANSFYQVNPVQTEKLYSTAIQMANLKKDEVLIDAYCGIGTIGLICADSVKNVLGVEINAKAIADAKINCKINNIENAEYVAQDAGKFMLKLATKKEPIDVVIMDPARAGADTVFLDSLIKLAPKKVVYISCNPVTQKDNVNYLCKHGYSLKSVQPVDMFPFTEHVENIALLVRK